MADTKEVRFRSPAVRMILVLVLLFSVAALDYLTGYELGFFVFYYIPTALAAWLMSLYAAAAVAIASAMLWIGVDIFGGKIYPGAFIAVWNTVVRLVAFLVIAAGVHRIRELLDRERQASEDLRRAVAEITVLEGILPICASCKKIRNPQNEWQQMEQYITEHSEAQFSHGLCPDCARRAMEAAGLVPKQEKTPEKF